MPLGKTNRDNFPEIQKLIVNEFQPYETISIGDLLGGIGNAIGDTAQGIMNFVGGGIMSGIKYAAMNQYIDSVSKNTSSLYKTGTRQRKLFSKDPVQVVENIFNGGKWLNTFELPYYGTEYLQGKYKDKWKIGNIEDSLGKGIGGIASNFGVDYPSNPKFTVGMSEGGMQGIKTSFYLVNSNDTWLKRNFKFIHAIFAGTSWLHLNYCMVRSTNVYNVHCPGRWMMMWAAMDCTVNFEGKLRKNPAVSSELGQFSKAIDADMLWPDAWKITLEFRDLTPNNFNMYANYYMNGYNADEISQLAQKKGLKDILSELGSYMSEMVNDVKAQAKDMMDDIKKAKGSLSETTENLNLSMLDTPEEKAKYIAEQEKKKLEKNDETFQKKNEELEKAKDRGEITEKEMKQKQKMLQEEQKQEAANIRKTYAEKQSKIGTE